MTGDLEKLAALPEIVSIDSISSQDGVRLRRMSVGVSRECDICGNRNSLNEPGPREPVILYEMTYRKKKKLYICQRCTDMLGALRRAEKAL